MMRRIVLVLIALLLPAAAHATVYPVPYSGQLAESSQLVNGTRYFSFRVYSVGVGGSSLATQSESLTVVKGVYHTMLNIDSSIWDGSDRWVGVSVNGAAELTPRIKVGWVPYAAYAPRGTPSIFAGIPNGRTVTSDQWTKIDSVTVTVTDPGFAVVSILGFMQWTGSISVAPLQLELSPTTPTDFVTAFNPPTGNIYPLSMTTDVSTPAGQTTIYLWAKLTLSAQTFLVQTKRFQAMYIPAH